MTDEQAIDLIYYLDRIAMAVEALAKANNPEYDGARAAANRMIAAKREMNAKRQKLKAQKPPSREDPE